MNPKQDLPNHCWAKYVQIGPRNTATNAAIRIAHAVLDTDYYNQLRTKQQLGYIVHSGLKHDDKSLGMIFLVQSSSTLQLKGICLA